MASTLTHAESRSENTPETSNLDFRAIKNSLRATMETNLAALMEELMSKIERSRRPSKKRM